MIKKLKYSNSYLINTIYNEVSDTIEKTWVDKYSDLVSSSEKSVTLGNWTKQRSLDQQLLNFYQK